MTDSLRISGKKLVLPAPAAGVKLEARPGGWVVVTLPSGERRRMAWIEARGKAALAVGGNLFQTEVVAGQARGGGTGALDDSVLQAQFPGKVRKLLVAEGDTVTAGQPLVLVEAMKMEFSVQAPYAGKVARICVKEGQQLSPGDRFVEIKAAT